MTNRLLWQKNLQYLEENAFSSFAFATIVCFRMAIYESEHKVFIRYTSDVNVDRNESLLRRWSIRFIKTSGFLVVIIIVVGVVCCLLWDLRCFIIGLSWTWCFVLVISGCFSVLTGLIFIKSYKNSCFYT